MRLMLFAIVVVIQGWSALPCLAHELKVLTLNTWLLDVPVGPFGLRAEIAREFKTRLKKLPETLAQTHADIIILQEVWSQNSKQTLVREMRSRGYLYAAYTNLSHKFLTFETQMGDGLLVLSKFEISPKAEKFDFSSATTAMEGYAQKGALRLEIRHPDLGWIDVFASHLGAINFENGQYSNSERAKQAKQLQELASWISATRKHPVTVLGADLNMHYQKWPSESTRQEFTQEYSDEYLSLVKSACGARHTLIDSYLVANHLTARDPAEATFSQSNPYTQDGSYTTLPSETEDYIFVCDNDRLVSQSSSIVFKDSPVSDHYGVITQFSSPGTDQTTGLGSRVARQETPESKLHASNL